MGVVEMQVLDPGRVTLSDRRTQSSWSAELAGFSISTTPVTQRTWSELTDQAERADQVALLELDRPRHSVSWRQAAGFCNALSRVEAVPAPRRHTARRGRPLGSAESGTTSAMGGPR